MATCSLRAAERESLPFDQPPVPVATVRSFALSVPAISRPTVRVAYLVPTNRTEQTDAVYKLQSTILAYQSWYRDQMERNGFGPKTFSVETEPDGYTPKIHTVRVNTTDAALRGDLWSRTIDAAAAAGIPVWSSRQIWWLVPEAHLLSSDGSLTGGTALGAGFGSGDDGGVGMIGSDGLVRMKPEYLVDNRPYAGRILPDLGPYRLIQGKTFPWFEGTTLSSVSSSIVGAGLHELSHAFGLPHNMRNDDNMHGNLMGNGLRGWRGALYPDRYGSDYVRLSYGNALFLNFSRYFNSQSNFSDNTKPALTLQTPPSVQTTNGTLTIQFRCSDAGGLGAAWLLWKGELVDEMPLSGTISTQRFATPFFSTGESTEYKVVVVDRQGNRTEMARNFTVALDGNAAPEPKIKITPTFPVVGQTVIFDATGSSDATESSTSLQAEWDFDGDGTFDTTPSSNRRAVHSFDEPGIYLARARLRDPSGAMTLSAPIGFRVVSAEDKLPRLDLVHANGPSAQLRWPISPWGYALQSAPALNGTHWTPLTAPPVVWGVSNVATVPIETAAEFFRLAR